MKTWMDALGTCTAAGGSGGGGPVPDSDASPDIPRPPIRSCFLPAGGAGGIGPATCGQAPAYFATRRYLAAVACRGRVEDWRADLRLRWVIHRFRGGPQSGCHDHVSSPRRIERSVRVSRTT